MTLSDAFQTKYGFSTQNESFAPYRICPLGAHVDHNMGKITGFAIDKGIHIAYTETENGIVRMQSLQFNSEKEWSIQKIPVEKQEDWADHLRGATIALAEKYLLQKGIIGLIDGDLPIGGLSSSASVIIAFLICLCKVNQIHLSESELLNLAHKAENNYVGVACGKLDQSCEIFGKKDHLLYMDMLDSSYSLIPRSAKMKPFVIGIFFSGLERSLASSKYNLRVEEARCAAHSLLAYAGMEYGKMTQTNLRDVPKDVFLQYKNRLPLPFAKRAEHWFSETERVEQGVAAWKNGDLELFGSLIFESGKSSIVNWEAGSPELIRLQEIFSEISGIYGGRFSGAGFKGCAMAFLDPANAEEILQQVEQKYTASFPKLNNKYTACLCQTADGVILP